MNAVSAGLCTLQYTTQHKYHAWIVVSTIQQQQQGPPEPASSSRASLGGAGAGLVSNRPQLAVHRSGIGPHAAQTEQKRLGGLLDQHAGPSATACAPPRSASRMKGVAPARTRV